MKRPHFALPEIYDDSLSYYDVLRKLIKSMHAIVDNLNKIPEQIANEAKARLLGDQGLQTNIDNEAVARQEADNELRELISTSGGGVTEAQLNEEVTARQQADTVLDGKISELKGDLSKETTNRISSVANEQNEREKAVNEEKQRAIARENEIEALFTAPTEEAVTKWLDEHPEATTTVQDHSLTIDKMVIGALGYVTPEMFGAVGDGVTDDTVAILKACTCGVDTVIFPSKTYVINIEAGESESDNRIFFPCTCSTILGTGKSVIKLGSGNGDTTQFRGYVSIFSFGGGKNVRFENMIIDFNYSENPIHQYTSNNVGVEVNGQQMAINADDVKSLVVNNCIFIEHSGTNCVNLRTAKANNDGVYARVTNCKFLQVGKKSIYNGNEDAYHDCSTISLHVSKSTSQEDEPFVAIVSGNTFEGVGGNAYDACECSAKEFYFENNTILNYVVGVMPLATYENSYVFIRNNTFKGVAKGVGLWNNNIDTVLSGGTVCFEFVDVSNNHFNIDVLHHLETPNFETLNNVYNGYYKGTKCFAVGGIGNYTKSFGDVKITNNIFDFTDVSNIADDLYLDIYDGSAICFSILYNGSEPPTSPVRYNSFIVKNNRFHNLPNKAVILLPFSQHGDFMFDDNVIKGCWKRNINQDQKNSGLIRLLIKNDGGFDGKFNLLSVCRNIVEYDFSDTFYGVVFFDATGSMATTEIKRVLILDNVTKKPFYGLYRITDGGFAEKYERDITTE